MGVKPLELREGGGQRQTGTRDRNVVDATKTSGGGSRGGSRGGTCATNNRRSGSSSSGDGERITRGDLGTLPEDFHCIPPRGDPPGTHGALQRRQRRNETRARARASPCVRADRATAEGYTGVGGGGGGGDPPS